MSINNKELIKPLLKFKDEGDFYMLYIFKRKKDQPEDEKDNNQSVRTIKTYCVESIEYLDKRWDEIVHLCEYFNARAYIHLSASNHETVGINMLVEISTKLRDGCKRFQNVFDSVVGQLKTREKLWIIDIDSPDKQKLGSISNCIEECQPYHNRKVVATIPTKNGFHLISHPFNVEEFRQHGFTEDIQKKNPTLLYLPDSLHK